MRAFGEVKMAEKLYAKGVKFEELKRAIESTLAEVDQGKHDAALRKAGVERPTDVKLASVSVTQSQYLSPEEWTEIIAVFGPLAVAFGKDIWKIIVVPKLKRSFRDDRIADSPPKRGKEKKKR
jgi:hypothetical protein